MFDGIKMDSDTAEDNYITMRNIDEDDAEKETDDEKDLEESYICMRPQVVPQKLNKVVKVQNVYQQHVGPSNGYQMEPICLVGDINNGSFNSIPSDTGNPSKRTITPTSQTSDQNHEDRFQNKITKVIRRRNLTWFKIVEMVALFIIIILAFVLLAEIKSHDHEASTQKPEQQQQVTQQPVSTLSTSTSTPAHNEHETSMNAHCGVGLADGRIKDSQINASGERDEHWSRYYIRLNNKQSGWIHKNGWIQFDLNSSLNISGLLTKGAFNTEAWVITFKVSFGSSIDDMNYVQDPFNGVMVFTGNHDQHTQQITYFNHPITARYVRIEPGAFHNSPALRMELLAPTNLLSEEGKDLPRNSICIYRKTKLIIGT